MPLTGEITSQTKASLWTISVSKGQIQRKACRLENQGSAVLVLLSPLLHYGTKNILFVFTRWVVYAKRLLNARHALRSPKGSRKLQASSPSQPSKVAQCCSFGPSRKYQRKKSRLWMTGCVSQGTEVLRGSLLRPTAIAWPEENHSLHLYCLTWSTQIASPVA